MKYSVFWISKNNYFVKIHKITQIFDGCMSVIYTNNIIWGQNEKNFCEDLERLKNELEMQGLSPVK